MHAYRTHTCGQLRKTDVGQTVRLSGWVNRRRDHGGLIFIDLRDHYGVTQCVIEPGDAAFAVVDTARSEWVLTFTGKVVNRLEGTANADLPTGEVELRIEQAEVQSAAQELPLPVFGDMPEGARDFLVPSRRYPGQFYALPQAPQQFKQLIQVAGFDRYFQIAPCFRDEDGRADRSPGEFYQLDMEMSFVTQDDVFAAIEPVLSGVFEEFASFTGKTRIVDKAPFRRIPYAQAMLEFGSDKPDLRNPIRIADVSDVFGRADVEFKAFKGKTVRAIPAPGAGAQARSFFDKLNDWARSEGAPGLGYVILEDEGGALTGKGPIAKFIPAAALADIAKAVNAKAGDAVFFAADKEDRAARLAGLARTRIGHELGLIEPDAFRFCWVVDYPMYEWNEDEKRIDFSHNPFSMPQTDRDSFLKFSTATDKDALLALKVFQYDVVCNGYEMLSGAIRNRDPDVMLKAFEIAGYPNSETEARFGGMLNAFRFGAPPHGGLAVGLERVVMLLAGEENIREVTMFPLTHQGQDLLMSAPSDASAKQLKELHLRVVYPEKP